MFFQNRTEAGQRLASQLIETLPELKNNPHVLVLALPRGGVPVGFEIAKKLGVQFDLIISHKLGYPENSELAIGAVAEDGSAFIDPAYASSISKDYIKNEIAVQLAEIKKRIKKYRLGKPLASLQDRIIILVDDGIATGNTMKAAIALAKKGKARKIIIAVPILPKDTLSNLPKDTQAVFLDTPYPFLAIGRFYRDFPQLHDEEVRFYLEEASK